MSEGSGPGAPTGDGAAAPGPRNRRRRWLIGGIVAAVVVIAAAVFGGIAIGRSAASAPLTLIAAGSAGPNPFTESTQRDPAPAASRAVAEKTAGLRASLPKAEGTGTPVAGGATPGLYGGSGDGQVCDPQKLVTFLGGAPAKAAAWARVLGIAPAKIASYVAGLTPAVLGSDTLVQNHGYRSGAATSFPAILQAGTAVLVDASGFPRVKCNCGNPLTEPQPLSVSSTATTGTRWAGYRAGSVIMVTPGAANGSLPLVDLTTGRVYRQPVGAGTSVWAAATWSSSADIGLVDQTDLWTSADGSSWTHAATIPHTLVDGLAWGDGLWVAVAQRDDQSSIRAEILTSSNLTAWTTAATVDGRLRGVAFGAGRWLAVGDPATGYSDTVGLSGASGQAMVYSSGDGTTWTKTATVTTPGLDGFWSVAYGGGRWLTTAYAMYEPKSEVPVYQSTDASNWTVAGTPIADQAQGTVAYGAGTWRIAAATTYPADAATGQPAIDDTLIDSAADGSAWSTSGPESLKKQLPHGLAYGGGRWLAGSEDAELLNQAHSIASTQVTSSDDGTTWRTVGRIDGPLGALAYGSVASGSAGPSTGSPGPTPPSSPTPAPTATAPVTTPGADAPDCSSAALQRALAAAGLTGTIGSDLVCSGGWAAAGVNHPESQTTSVFQWVNGAWQLRDRTQVCAQDSLPPAVAPAACSSN